MMAVKTHMPNACPKNPHTRGNNIIDKLPTAISVPMIEGVRREPNNSGIRYAIFGNKGPLPSPMKKKPAAATYLCEANSSTSKATPKTDWLMKISFQLCKREAANPARKRPQARPT